MSYFSFREVCPDFHAYRIRAERISFYLTDWIVDMARFAHDRANAKPNTQFIPKRFHDFFEFADIFFEEEDDDG